MKWTIFLLCALVQAQTPVKHIQTSKSGIASAVWAGDTLYVSGQIATPITPADRDKGTPAVYGDTKAQAASSLSKIEAILKEQGLTMGNVVAMHVFMAGDPANGGKLDFAGMNASYAQFRHQRTAQQTGAQRDAGGGAGRARGAGGD